MKMTAFILSILISALATMMPCSDNITCEQVNTSSQYSNVPVSHSHNDDKGDLCTPFCSCTCCSSAIFSINIPSFHTPILKEVIPPTAPTLYKSNFISCYFYSFWQPPKISLS